MPNENRLNAVSKAPAFRLDGGDLYRLARHHYRLTPNPLSPFKGQPEDGLKLSPEAAALASDPDIKRLAAVLAAPDLKVSFRTGGMAKPAESFSLYCRREGKETAAVGLHPAGALVEALYFDSIASYCSYFTSLYAAPVIISPPNPIKPEVSLEVMLLVLALIDCYRRAYLNGMLSGEAAPVEAVYEDEFLAVFEHELKSPDMRWLLPSFLRLVPGLTETPIVFSGEQMDVVRALGFSPAPPAPLKTAPCTFSAPRSSTWAWSLRCSGMPPWASRFQSSTEIPSKLKRLAVTSWPPLPRPTTSSLLKRKTAASPAPTRA
mgnify:CR=1 FL=1